MASGVLRRAADSAVLRPVTRSRPFRLVRRSWRRPMTASHALRVIESLADAGIHVWVAGGWGVDALLGRRTRAHDDLDLLCEDGPDIKPRSRAALAALGYRAVPAERGGLYMRLRIVSRDRAGRTVDLIPVRLTDAETSDPSAYTPASFTRGWIGGREVGCLTAAEQLRLHQGYVSRRQDRRDVTLLCRRFDLAPPEGYE